MNVAVPRPQHSPILGQRALSHTVWSPASTGFMREIAFTSRSLTLSQSGRRSTPGGSANPVPAKEPAAGAEQQTWGSAGAPVSRERFNGIVATRLLGQGPAGPTGGPCSAGSVAVYETEPLSARAPAFELRLTPIHLGF